jgi:hypothetical protein
MDTVIVTIIILKITLFYNSDILFACLSDGTIRQQECFSIIMSQRMPDVNGMTATGKPLLVAACENGVIQEKVCLMLLERGADVNATDKVRQSRMI